MFKPGDIVHPIWTSLALNYMMVNDTESYPNVTLYWNDAGPTYSKMYVGDCRLITDVFQESEGREFEERESEGV